MSRYKIVSYRTDRYDNSTKVEKEFAHEEKLKRFIEQLLGEPNRKILVYCFIRKWHSRIGHWNKTKLNIWINNQLKEVG